MAHIDRLRALLDLEKIDQNEFHDEFIGTASNEQHIRAFGGQVAAQALVAAGLTVDATRRPNSLHSYFIRPGNPTRPTSFRVNRIRDGRSFSTRSVDAVQNDKTIFSLTASFHIEETGLTHADNMPEVTPPSQLTPFDQRFAGRDQTDMVRWFGRAKPFDIRYVDNSPFDFAENGSPAQQRVWVKALDRIDSNPVLHSNPLLHSNSLLHSAIFTYISDMTVLDAILLRHGIKWTDEEVLGASLDHAVWFHQPFRVDEWLLLDQESPIASHGRGLARGRVWTENGDLVITFAQEALLRPPHVS